MSQLDRLDRLHSVVHIAEIEGSQPSDWDIPDLLNDSDDDYMPPLAANEIGDSQREVWQCAPMSAWQGQCRFHRPRDHHAVISSRPDGPTTVQMYLQKYMGKASAA